MPELPEMETYKQQLHAILAGKRIIKTEVQREKSINVTADLFKQELNGAVIVKIDRRAKHLIFHLSTGKFLLLHLMLGGWMYAGNEQDAPDRTKQITLTFDSIKLYFIGLRLGYLHLHNKQTLEEELADLGPEPLQDDFNRDAFQQLLEGRRGMLKTTLVNQHVIAGIGNCYSDEICYEAYLLPDRGMDMLSEEEKDKLYSAMVSVLTNATQLGGYMENPLFQGDQLTGCYNDHCLVYDREGMECNRCHSKIVKTEISSRKSFFCPGCQK
ncbi:MAG: DNA-formamidopyrimidine glycosylase family protein [Cytobacillus gottheilii]|uniref:Fpg/Nei family DNA glycosylase n=1 Tax=Cytobacillus gottheilii TaxID=859144 RepID=UPI003463B7F5